MNILRRPNFPEAIRTFFHDHEEWERSGELLRRKYWKTHDAIEEKKRSFAWIQGKSGLPWLELSIKFPFEEMLEEARRLRHRFVSHRSGGRRGYLDGNRGWTALTIHGLGSEITGNAHNYGYEDDKAAPHKWTEIADMCPVTTRFLKRVYPCDKFYRVRFMVMAPQGFIFPHTDRENSYLGEVNFALNHPTGCFLKMKGAGFVPFRAGKAFILDVSNIHAVVNLSDEERYHMIVHGETIRNEKWGRLIEKSYRDFMRRK
ncbi:MAG TPA: aspartyl/asparaginyl beta-hydroxylase domain-containing protein [Bdellovibrionota bacterium]|nr:aspartyl/asparaginyl beta-hydroxylase domain-containing protein [Bdellovibrionota bacterium]